MTDGVANVGLTASHELVEMARRLPDYSKNTVHTLGLELEPGDGLNAELLKDLALDSNGAHMLARDKEAVSTFLGDVFADHLMRRFERCQATLKRCSDGVEASLVTSVPKPGFVLRADRPTVLVFKWPEQPQRGAASVSPPALSVEQTKAALLLTGMACTGPRELAARTAIEAPEDADPEAIAAVARAYGAFLLDRVRAFSRRIGRRVRFDVSSPKSDLEDFKRSLAKMLSERPDLGLLASVLGQLEKVSEAATIGAGEMDAGAAAVYYCLSSGVGSDSVAVEAMRYTSRMSSQNYASPVDSPASPTARIGAGTPPAFTVSTMDPDA